MKKLRIAILSFPLLAVIGFFSNYALAHHSFGIYDVYNDPIEFTGVVERWRYTNPHSLLTIKVDEEFGGCVWTMEVRNRLWDAMELPRDLIKPNDKMTIMLWPKRDSAPEALMGAFHVEGQDPIVLQTSATGNSNPPTDTATISRPVCED